MDIQVGVDLLSIERITVIFSSESEAFERKVFTEREQSEAKKRINPINYYATRFAGKEAVFKSLEISGSTIQLKDIEILSSTEGIPIVQLHGNLKKIVMEKGFLQTKLSLSSENNYAIAYALSFFKKK